MSFVRAVAVDTGGTFTDVLLSTADGLISVKLPSTPDDPSLAVIDGIVRAIARDGDDAWPARVVHGTTVGTNTLLERDGVRVVFVTTSGFEDVLALGRQARLDLYALRVHVPEPIVSHTDTVGTRERLAADGSVLVPLEPAEIARVVEEVANRVADGAQAVAICLLHAYAESVHEERLEAAIAAACPGLYVCRSSTVLAEFREFERASTTVAEAFIAPRVRAYLARLDAEIARRSGDAPTTVTLSVMQSNGGLASIPEIARHPIHTALSGPAGGVLGGMISGAAAGFEQVVTFDMGGTSSDVGFCDGSVALTTSGAVGDTPVRVPMVDVHTVGAGGGSIAWIDRGGALKVGPRSAGAVPGPACYGRGGRLPTVTDANLVLGRLSPAHFLAGEMTLDLVAAHSAVSETIAEPLGLTVEAAAEGIIAVVNAAMARAINVMSVERGHTPEALALVAFGGAGGMHGCALAAQVGIPTVVIPPLPGLLSAYGMLHADLVHDVSRTVLVPLDAISWTDVQRALNGLRAEVGARFSSGGAWETLVYEASADLRYEGQSFELRVPVGANASLPSLREGFEETHRQRYGFALDQRVELVTLRTRCTGVLRPPAPMVLAAGVGAESAITGSQTSFFGSPQRTAILSRALLGAGDALTGPALVVEYTGTAVVPPGWRLTVSSSGALVLRRLDGQVGPGTGGT